MGLKRIKNNQICLKNQTARTCINKCSRFLVSKQIIFSNRLNDRAGYNAQENKSDGPQQKRQQNKDSYLRLLRITVLELIHLNSRLNITIKIYLFLHFNYHPCKIKIFLKMYQDCQHVVENNYTKSLQGRKIYKDQCVRCFRDPVLLILCRNMQMVCLSVWSASTDFAASILQLTMPSTTILSMWELHRLLSLTNKKRKLLSWLSECREVQLVKINTKLSIAYGVINVLDWFLRHSRNLKDR